LLLKMLSAERPGAVPAPLVIDEKRAWMLFARPRTFAGRPAGRLGLDRRCAEARQVATELRGSDGSAAEFSCVDRRLVVLDAELDRLFGPNPATDRLDPGERALLPQRAESCGPQ
jgi:hypothetical protein